jgi:hypothetical protein
MEASERRESRRLKLRLPITRMECSVPLMGQAGVWTSDISTGGMFFIVQVADPPKPGSKVSFELVVPAGEGYSVTGGRIVGQGEVARVAAINERTAGIAMKFNAPLDLAF